jgi:glycosyltransferase involved in cell wall biosynthesis
MNILYIVQHFSGPHSSSGSRPYENARLLVARGHDVTLLCGHTEGAADADIELAREAGIVIHRAPVCYGHRMSYTRRLLAFHAYMRWAVRTGKACRDPDVIFASSTPLTVGEIGRKVAAHHRVPLVFEVRDVWPEVPIALGALRNPVLRWLAFRMARRVYAASSHIVALSPDMKSMIELHGVAPDKISVIPNCSDTAFFGNREGRTETRDRYGWAGKFVCIHPGAMGIVNGLDYLLDVAKCLDARDAGDILVALVGGGRLREHLADRIRKERIRSAVLYDPVAKKDMAGLLAGADVGLMSVADRPHLAANSANKFFDFLAAGLPVVLNYGGWKADVLRDSGAGVTCSPQHPAAFAEVLMRLTENSAECERMGRAARLLAESQYDRSLLVGQLENVLLSAV